MTSTILPTTETQARSSLAGLPSLEWVITVFHVEQTLVWLWALLGPPRPQSFRCCRRLPINNEKSTAKLNLHIAPTIVSRQFEWRAG